jgi:hypothetical protein
MEECAESSRVIVVCTPKYKKKASNPEGGVGYEKIILTFRMMKNLSNDEVIPLLRKGNEHTAIPTFLSGRLYVDFRDDSNYKNQLEELVKQILGFIPRIPPLKKPEFQAGEMQIKTHKDTYRNSIPGDFPEIGSIQTADKRHPEISTKPLTGNAVLGLIIVGDIVDFSLMTGIDQGKVMENLWNFLSKHELLRPEKNPAILGTLDGAVVALQQVDCEKILDFAVKWIEEMKNNQPSAGLKVGIHAGTFEVIDIPGNRVKLVIGTGPNDCSRIVKIGDAGNILVSEEFVKTFERHVGDSIYHKFIPGKSKEPMEVFVKRGGSQSIRIYNYSNDLTASAPRRLAILDLIDRYLKEVILPEIENFFIVLLQKGDPSLKRHKIRPRISILAPDPHNRSILASTNFRYSGLKTDPGLLSQGSTTYSLEGEGQGPCGRAFNSSPPTPKVVNNLPNYRQRSLEYIYELNNKWDIPVHIIRNFRRHARAFIAFPFLISEEISERDGVICIDTKSPLESIPVSELVDLAEEVMVSYSDLIAALWRLRV